MIRPVLKAGLYSLIVVFCLSARAVTRVWIAAGTCSSNIPNMPSASTKNNPAKEPMIHGFWNNA